MPATALNNNQSNQRGIHGPGGPLERQMG